MRKQTTFLRVSARRLHIGDDICLVYALSLIGCALYMQVCQL